MFFLTNLINTCVAPHNEFSTFNVTGGYINSIKLKDKLFQT